MERAAGVVRVSGRPAAVDKVFVAVDEEHGRGTLLWALQNLAKEGAMIVIVHVHCPAQTIRVMGVEVHHTMINPQVFRCQKLTTENDEVAKGLEELIALHGITHLVMGAAADGRYSNALLSWRLNWSKTACRLMEAAKESCKIWFTCKGHLVCTREGNGKSFAKLPPPTEEALIEVQYFRELAHEESTKRRKTEQDLFSALQMIGEWKMLHQHEIWGRQAIEEQYLRDRQEVREMIRKFEAIYDQLDDVQELKWRITEMETARKNHKEALITSNNFIKILQADNENLQQELMQRITEMESAREGHKEELAVSKSRIKMLQADKKKLQRELKQCITEMESARKDHKEELVTSNYLVKKLQADNKKLHYDLNRCITDIQSARKDYEEELTTSKYLVELLQSDKETLQKDLQAALTEAVDLRRKSLLSSASEADSTSPPSYFVCPISQEVMSDPHVAADGFTYGGEEIRGWLDSGHDTSPMTNLKLSHSVLTPNRALRSAILEWQQQQQHST
ncbi:hypothetical protein SETIT_1G264500v2 [Setaria italica]|uniref:RING-type E3 ubiquitin transferase n=1 Tax=Setaria italica TaxID=4555 RepID=A0A368PQH1_SETIT|nr:hypothetical protein SETIT_1G264500v2 [Setaria italica]